MLDTSIRYMLTLKNKWVHYKNVEFVSALLVTESTIEFDFTYKGVKCHYIYKNGNKKVLLIPAYNYRHVDNNIDIRLVKYIFNNKLWR